MPRGNDTEASTELREQYGDVRNAEELIRSQATALSPEVRAASAKAVDEDATVELDLAALSKQSGRNVVSACVRGGETICIEERPDGRTVKFLLGQAATAKPKKAKRAAPDSAGQKKG